MITRSFFGKYKDQNIYLYELVNESGLKIKLMNYGATIASIRLPDDTKESAEVVCGFDTLEAYLADSYQNNFTYFGSTIGRVANRIKDGLLVIGEEQYQLEVNNGSNHLHGGSRGFDRKVWDSKILGDRVVMELNVGHLEDGFPGNIKVNVTFELGRDDSLKIQYSASTDRPTVLSMTNHSYFNLSGFVEGVENHQLHVPSTGFLVKDESGCPIGLINDIPVDKDFNELRRVGAEELDDFLVFPESASSPRQVGSLIYEERKRRLDFFSTEAGAQVYNGKYVSSNVGRSATQRFGPGCAICFEAHDLPNLLGTQKSLITPDNPYQNTTVYKFSWEK